MTPWVFDDKSCTWGYKFKTRILPIREKVIKVIIEPRDYSLSSPPGGGGASLDPKLSSLSFAGPDLTFGPTYPRQWARKRLSLLRCCQALKVLHCRPIRETAGPQPNSYPAYPVLAHHWRPSHRRWPKLFQEGGSPMWPPQHQWGQNPGTGVSHHLGGAEDGGRPLSSANLKSLKHGGPSPRY